MSDTRMKNVSWQVTPLSSGSYSHDAAKTALLMDIRDELQDLNRMLRCPRFQQIPVMLEVIKRNTTKKKKHKNSRGAGIKR